MDKKTIELYAANTVEISILETEILHPSLSRNDKDLSWDGFIEVYKSKDKEKKANLSGRVAVQVKGTENNNHSKNITFPAETSDLRNYLRDKGVIYFVVRIHKSNPFKRKIYYETLTPVKLKQYLNGAEKQKTKTIQLKEFPSNKDERTSIVVNFLQHSIMQLSYVESGFIPLEEIKAGKHNYKIQLSGYGKQASNPLFTTILGKETYAYVTFWENKALIPVDTPVTIQELRNEVRGKVCIGEKCYYDEYERIISFEGETIKIGDSITIIFGKFKNTTVKTNITFSPFLKKAAKDMRFIVDAFSAGNFNVNSMFFRLDSLDADTLGFISFTKKRMLLFNKILRLFNILNIEEDLNIEKLTDKEQKHIEILVKAFVDQEDISHIAEKTPTSVLDLKISNIKLKLILVKNKNATYTIKDFFSSIVVVSYKDEEGRHLNTSPYSALSKDDYLTISNINFNGILDSYKVLVLQNVHIFERANLDMLQMLLAYDQSLNQKHLETAKSIAKWILDEGNIIGDNIRILNYLQIIKRERTLNKEEISWLCKIIEDSDASESEKIGVYLLLGNQVSAEIHFEKLTPKEQIEFKEYPIFKFYRKDK